MTRGAQAERQAKQFLIQAGLRFLEANYRCPLGEIDLIMEDFPACLVFVEVRYRNSVLFGGSLMSIDLNKQQKIQRTAEYYLSHRRRQHYSVRFDVIGFDVTLEHPQWIQDAF